MNYWLHPEAREDLREAAEFYRDNADVALSQSLLAEFEHPVTFGIIYTVVGDQLRILAVAHHSRRPGYWRARR